jgi:hypothetical protein
VVMPGAGLRPDRRSRRRGDFDRQRKNRRLGAGGTWARMAAAGYINASAAEFKPRSKISPAPETVTFLTTSSACLYKRAGRLYGRPDRSAVCGQLRRASPSQNCDRSGAIYTSPGPVTGLTLAPRHRYRGTIRNFSGRAEITQTDVSAPGPDLSAPARRCGSTIPDGYTPAPDLQSSGGKRPCARAEAPLCARPKRRITATTTALDYQKASYAAEGRIFALEGYLWPDTYDFYLGSSPHLGPGDDS